MRRYDIAASSESRAFAFKTLTATKRPSPYVERASQSAAKLPALSLWTTAVICAAAAAAENGTDVDRMIASRPVLFNIFDVIEGW